MNRTPDFARNDDLERLLREVNDSLRDAELAVTAGLGQPHLPPLLVVGALRSGTTLVMQWLAAGGQLAYPSNLLSRFFGAPALGARIQRLLTDPRYRFRDELDDLAGPVDYASQNGKTRGALAPNEFTYFWRRFLPFCGELDYLPDDQLRQQMDGAGLRRELAGVTEAFARPFALKAMILNYHLPLLHELLPGALVLRVRRDPVDTAASILGARRRQFGDERPWYSYKIREYPRLKDLEPIEQVSGQVHFINRALDAGLAALPEPNRLEFAYADFCADPAGHHARLVGKLNALGADLDPRYGGEAAFTVHPGPDADRDALRRALARWEDQTP